MLNGYGKEAVYCIFLRDDDDGVRKKTGNEAVITDFCRKPLEAVGKRGKRSRGWFVGLLVGPSKWVVVHLLFFSSTSIFIFCFCFFIQTCFDICSTFSMTWNNLFIGKIC
jgi:hypothetical protein